MNELMTIESNSTDVSALIFDPIKLQAMQTMAKAMSEAAIAVPVHFRGKPGDCLAVVMQAAQWGMNPFACAQKTHVVNGALGYEAQLVNAVVSSSGAISGRFHYEYRNEGANVECRVGAVIRGESDITWGEWLSAATVTTKNSPLWKTNPKQQLGYLQVKNWARAYTPGAILGVYSEDELAAHPMERDITPEAQVIEPAAPVFYDQAEFEKNLPAWRKAIQSGKRTVEQLNTFLATNGRQLSNEQIKAIKDCEPIDVGGMTFAEVADAMNTAGDTETLDVKADLIRQVSDETQQAELTEMYRSLRTKMEA